MSREFNHITPYLAFILKKHNKFINQKVKKYKLSFGQFPLLIEIYKKPGIIQEVLAETLYLDESTITRNLEKLEEKKLIIKVKNPKNKRMRFLECTKEGEEIAKVLLNLEYEWEEKTYKSLNKEDMENLARILEKVYQDLN